jgi:hypothetical protein
LLVFLPRPTYPFHQLQIGNVHADDARADGTEILAAINKRGGRATS